MSLTLHALPPSHPCMTVKAALELKGLEYELVDMPMSGHTEAMEAIYGAGHGTVPGMLFDDEPVHTSRAILARLDELEPDPPLYTSDEVREAERWGDEELQDLGRCLPWGAMHFRPESLGTFAPGGKPLDPAGTDFAMRFVRAAWKYHGITCERIANDLAALPGKLDHIDGLIADGVLGGDSPNAADLQIGATLLVLLNVGDVRQLIEGRAAAQLARRFFPAVPGETPAGAFPGDWLP